MKFTEKTIQHIDSCRFCWMCRHICPVSIATGQERNTSRARALSLSLVARGAETINEVADNLFECALCGACVKECVTGWDPVMFTREARTVALLEGAMPNHIENLLVNLEEKGNVYGKDLPDYIAERKGNKTLLFLGEDTRFMSRDSYLSATEILDKAGVKYDVRLDEVNSGASMYFITAKSNESKVAMQNCAKFINEYDEVIVYDPQDYKLFVREYKEFGVEITAKLVNFNDYMLGLLDANKLAVKKGKTEYTIQDNFNYSRELSDSETARKIIAKVGNLKEFLMNGKDTMYAGSLLMHEYMAEQMERVAGARWKNALGVDATTVVTESPSEYEMLKMTKPEGVRVISIEKAILENI